MLALGTGKGQDNSTEPTEQDNSFFFDSDLLFIKKTKAAPQDTRAKPAVTCDYGSVLLFYINMSAIRQSFLVSLL